ncbi:hypothetical protein D3C78_596160 [compost metagenome]
MLEDARRQLRILRALAGVQLAFGGDVHRLARRQVADQGEAEHVQRHAFRGDHVLDAFVGVTLAEHDRADAVGIAEADDAVAGDHRHHRVAAAAALMHAGDRGEDVVGGRLQLAAHGQLVGEHVEQHFRVGVGVDVAQVGFVDLARQLLDVGQVAVVRQGDAVGRVDVERLRLGRAGAAGGRIAHMADPDIADQALHMPSVEHVADQAVVLAQEQATAMAGHDAGSVLAAVLKNRKGVVERLVDVRLTHNTNDATHVTQPLESQAKAERPRDPEGRRHWSTAGRTRAPDSSTSRQSSENRAAAPTVATRDPAAPVPG